jgi:hypothetical protein
MKEFLNFILASLQGIFIGILMLIAGLVFVPDTITLKILRRFKPDLIRRQPFMVKVRDAFEIMLGKRTVVPSSGSGESEKRRLATIQEIVKERETLQGNLFFLDLLKNFSRTLYFAVSSDGQSQGTALSLSWRNRSPT